MHSINPATEQEIETYQYHDDETVERKLSAAADAFRSWRQTPIEERESLLSSVTEVLSENVEKYATLITDEVGKPIAQSRAEVEKCVWLCEYYAKHAAQHLQDDRIGTVPGVETTISYEPLGPILAVMPWNYPFWQVFRFAAPHLTAGNVGILKHAPNVFGCAQAIESVFKRAGYPDAVFTSLQVPTERVSSLIEDRRIRAVTLTGSTRAGRTVAEQSGRELKPTVLELGGSDPFVVLEDAPLEQAAEVGAQARTQNSGQSCIAAKRFIVHEAVYDKFLDLFTAEMDSLTVGDPTDPNTDVGPQARDDLMATLDDQVSATIEAGATCQLGGEPLERPGYFYPPTILTDVPAGTPAAEEELFGPVASVFSVPSEAAAITMANDTTFGLGASIWTADTDRGAEAATEIKAGNVFINQLVKSDPRVPFGGIKDSGYGSELAEHGIKEFVNAKTIWVED
ncbi:NAD-dependent succinate-semialdehyde dehydrogenase [Haloplanus salinarum]|uniref:NAD-dependent succinate-semialdehyde dehydrogenase n=1 Tax=Haloplanus salinarum TaxID=1912324 RepID=UPI003B43AEE4